MSWFEGKRIATSYPGILKDYMRSKGVHADIHVITGSVEVAPGIGLSDAIIDVMPTEDILQLLSIYQECPEKLHVDSSKVIFNPLEKIAEYMSMSNNEKLKSGLTEDDILQVNQQNLTATSTDGNIKYTVTSPGTGVLQNTNGKANVIIKSEFVNKTSGNTNAYGSQAKLTVSLTYAQG